MIAAMKNFFRFPLFKTETRATTLADPAGILAALMSGAQVGSGSLTGEAAFAVPAVTSAIRVISDAVACLDLKVLRREGDSLVEDEAHPAAQLFGGAANDWTSGFELMRDLVADALMRDAGGLAFVNRINGELVEIVRYEPGAWRVEFDNVTAEPSYFIDGVKQDRSQILHFRGPFSRSCLTLAGRAIGCADVLSQHVWKLFSNGARPSGIIEIPSNPGKPALEKMKESWNAAMSGVANAGQTAVLFDGAKFNPLTMASTDAQFLELRKFQIIEIARAFRVPPSMLYELDRATWSNSEQMGREFLVYTLEPWLRISEGALSRSVFTDAERAAGYRIQFDRDDLTRADFAARMTAYSKGIAARIINPNEARKWEGLEEYQGGEIFQNPNIAIPADQPTKDNQP